ncbi:MAG: peptide-methionine (S)-S-oxide reductase, partial [Deltaproteobacteria bacterium]|nr:peptide-methionine (S)-S-oxide reductase [Deltaproteobacteria bacterium]
RGPQYRPGIFWTTEEQRDLALDAVGRIEVELGRPVRVEVTRAGTFYPAEDYHQGYAERNPLRYRMYRAGSGRDQTLDRIWGSGDKH